MTERPPVSANRTYTGTAAVAAIIAYDRAMWHAGPDNEDLGVFLVEIPTV
jgi:hypothetical protein